MKKLSLIFTAMVLSGYCCNASAPTDYFRSIQNGDWGSLATWESSPDNATWTAATLIPNSAANTISIQTGDTVTVISNQDMDQLVIENGGMLFHSAGTLTVNDGAGNDVSVQAGGIFTLASNANGPVFSPATASVNINTGGMLRLSATGLTGAGGGVNANNFIYQDASVLEYTLNLAFSSAGVTYFPNANVLTIPIFRITGNPGLIGAGTPLTINGIFEANGTVIFQNAGTKTFRNGIAGTGSITSIPTSGKFIINGADAIIGGTGPLTLPTAGMDIGPMTTVNMISDKTITGNIDLQLNAGIFLGTFNLTMSGAVTGGSPISHIVTNGTGKLILNNVGATPMVFPVGASMANFNPVVIYNGGGLNYGVRVEVGINPAIAVPLNAVNRTWFVTPNGGTPGAVNTNFFYAAGDANAGFNYAANLELGQHTGVWNVIQTGIVPAGSYQVATTVSTFGNNIEAPLVLANLGAILALNDPITVNYFTGVKQSAHHLLKWKLTCNSSAAVSMFLERSTNGIDYSSIFSEHATALRCQQPFEYNDARPEAGVNYYRIRMIDADGKTTYSTIILLINANTGIDILNIAPNPITGNSFNVKISAAKQETFEIFMCDIAGRVLLRKMVQVIAGFNVVPVNIETLTNGMFQLVLKTPDGQTKVLKLVVQK